MYMNGNSFPNYHYDPWTFMMMSQFMNQKKEDELKDEDIVRMFKKYSELKKEFEPPKKEDKKPDEKMTTGDYFIVFSTLLLGSSLIGLWIFVSKMIEFAQVLHK